MLAWLARALYRFVQGTARAEILPSAAATELLSSFDGPSRVIIAFWHDRLGMIQVPYRGPGFITLVSRHTDGEIITRALAPLGARTARGSASRGGVGAMRELLRGFEEGCDIAVAVDGPRGPRHEVKPGVVELARLTGAPLYPVACAPKGRYVFRRSWDQFVLPFPFTTIAYAAGPALRIPRDASKEDVAAARDRLEEALARLTREVEARFGRAA